MVRIAFAAALFAAGTACAQAPASIDPAELHNGWSLPPLPTEREIVPDETPPAIAQPTPSASSAPVPIESCDPAGCWDNQGNHYSGGGTTMTRTDGTVCQQIGTTIQCL